jgi:hypothetical protein
VIFNELFHVKYPLARKNEESVAEGEAVERRFSTAFPVLICTPSRLCPGRRRHARSVDIELVQSAVRIVPSAVGIVRPCRMCDSAVERQPGVVAIIDAVLRIMGVRRSCADLNVLRERLPAVRTKGPPNTGALARALRRVRHFALVEGFALPTKARLVNDLFNAAQLLCLH